MADIYKTSADRLTRLAGLDESSREMCRPDELATLWRCQLDAPLAFDLTSEIQEPGTTYAAAVATTAKPPATFRALLQHPRPPIELLKLAKDFAKTHAHGDGGALPREIGIALYYAVITVALTRCHERITSLSATQHRDGLKWAVAQPWLDESTRQLFEAGLKGLAV